MTEVFRFDKEMEVRVAFADGTLGDAERSRAALEAAMGVIYGMARRVNALLKELPAKEAPDRMETKFTIRFEDDGQAYLTEDRGALQVKLVWAREEKPTPILPPIGASGSG